MITFSCRCGNQLAVPEELAGGTIQCPQCGLLVDVPTPNDLETIADDGTYRVGETRIRPEPERFRDLERAYSRDRLDEDGNEIDLRLSSEQIARAGSEDLPEGKPFSRIPPRYDPETGMLVRPIDLENTNAQTPPEMPLPRRTLSYARRLHQESAPTPPLLAPLYLMFMPINLISLVFIWIFHGIITATIFPIAMGFLLLVPIEFLMIIMLIAHYANVVEDIGPDDHDELPRLFRHLSFGDDIWRPFVNLAMAFAYSFGLALLVMAMLPPSMARTIVVYALAAVGTLQFPAALLTSTTSGTVLNLRPDRVFHTIMIIGPRYAFLVLAFVLASIAYWGGIAGANAFTNSFFVKGLYSHAATVMIGVVASLGLPLGIYLMHYFCWILGLTYRRCHLQFNWVFQRHVAVARMVRPLPASVAAKYQGHALGQKINPSEGH